MYTSIYSQHDLFLCTLLPFMYFEAVFFRKEAALYFWRHASGLWVSVSQSRD